MNKKIMLIGTITLIIDQLLKIIVETNLTLNNYIVVIQDFFNIRNVNNYGAGWGILQNQRFLLIGVSIVALFIIYRYMNTFKTNWRNNLAFGLLYGGITGNLIDRLFLGYVRDFLDFNIFGYNFPVFIISDIAICIGVALLIFAIIKGEDNENKSRKKSTKN